MLNKLYTFLNKCFSKTASIFLVLYILFGPALILATSSTFAEGDVTAEIVQGEIVPSEPTESDANSTVEPESKDAPEIQTPVAVTEEEEKIQEEPEESSATNRLPVNIKVLNEADGDLAAKVVESKMCLADSLNACIATDKEDYAPTEVVLLNGAGYAINSNYKLVIYSSNEPSVRFETIIATDAQGVFSHSYQLDGVYRPNYSVEIYSLNASAGETLPVASTTFTDAPKVEKLCGNGVVDSGEQCDGTAGLEGHNDELKCSNKCEFDLVTAKVDVCHSTDSQTNPYISNTPDKSGDVHGHDGHNGVIWYEGIADHSWGDVIPPFWYIDEDKQPQYYEGKNWTEDGQKLLANGCKSVSDDDGDDDDEPGTIRIYKNVVYGNTSLDIFSNEIFKAVLGSAGEEAVMKDMSDRKDDPIVAEYSELNPAAYTITEYTEEMPTGYNFLGCKVKGSNDELQTTVHTNLESGEVQEFECVNQVEAQLQLRKTNNTGGADLFPGTDVLYTLTVSAPSNGDEKVPYVLSAVKVVDVTPAGIDYNGIWHAVLTRDGINYDLKALGLINEPSYHSPGTWDLSKLDEDFGGFIEGDVVTLTYGATISMNQDPGLYKDLAWTEGNNVVGMRIIGSAPISNIFAGTEVSVIAVPSDEEVSVQVLGVTLPNTGANWLLTISAVVMSLAGLVMLFLTKKPSKKVVTFVSAFFLLFTLFSVSRVNKAYAAGTNYIRLETPKSPTGNVNTKLGFVTLDVENNAMTVSCYVKAPGGAFVVFDTVNVQAGGNNGNCVLNSSILSVQGNYEFKATAGDAISEVVSMEFDNKGPLPVIDYTKTEGVCSNKLNFRTGDDSGETILVQIFRSDKKSFEANSSTKIKEISIGSNQNVTYTDPLPDCNKEYFYAVRAVDDANNTSLLVADKLVIVTQAPAEQSNGNVEGTGTKENENNEAVEGTNTEPDKNNNDGSSNDTTSNDKSDNKDVTVWDWFKYVLLATIIAGAGYGIYLYIKQRKPRAKKTKKSRK